MPRHNRIFVEGGFYHVFNRLGRGERFFEDETEARSFVDILRESAERDGLTVFAWCLMTNHYHLAVRTGNISLDRPMKSLQQRVTQGINARNKVYGPLWQGRYRAKLIADQRYLDRLLIYIHLNPVSAGIVDDPAQYRWSGHRDLLGKAKNPLVDVDEVLRVFGTSRRSARAAYVRQLKGGVEDEWIGEEPGHLPWWKLGRPTKGEDEDPESAVRQKRQREELGPDWRPILEAEEFVSRGASILGIEIDDLRSRGQSQNLARARELLMVVGVERYRIMVKDLARELRKSPDGMTQAVVRGVTRKSQDSDFLADLSRLDLAISDSIAQQAPSVTITE